MSYDLHTHSWISDGSLSPTALVQRAAAAGVRTLALTDHDDTAGCDEAQAAARSCDLQFLPGVEISVSWQGITVHIVALNIDPQAPALQAGLAGLREFRSWRAEEIGRRLAQRGIHGAYEDAAKRARGRIIGRVHFARFLVQQGYAKDLGSTFKHFLTPNKPGYVPGQWAALGEAVSWIRAAGGVAVVAHPARYPLTASKLRRLLGEFMECGGEAIEVISGSHSEQDAQTMARHAQDLKLYASTGSDFHDPDNARIELGRLPPLPDNLQPVWQLWQDAPATQPGLAYKNLSICN